MSFLPLTPGVRLGPGAGKGASSQSAPKPDTDKILQRDDYTCRFCGFRSRQYQRIIPYVVNGAQDFVTCCTFCEQCVTLERAGMMGTGSLVWLPEISQAELNHFVRSIYVAREVGGDIGDLAQRAYDALSVRKGDAKKRLGSDDPLLLATVMHEMLSGDEVGQAPAKLEGIRLLPLDRHLVRGKQGDVNQFPHMLKYWLSSEGPYGDFPPEKWEEMFRAAAGRVGNA